jgi:hypothetical protein
LFLGRTRRMWSEPVYPMSGGALTICGYA